MACSLCCKWKKLQLCPVPPPSAAQQFRKPGRQSVICLTLQWKIQGSWKVQLPETSRDFLSLREDRSSSHWLIYRPCPGNEVCEKGCFLDRVLFWPEYNGDNTRERGGLQIQLNIMWWLYTSTGNITLASFSQLWILKQKLSYGFQEMPTAVF